MAKPGKASLRKAIKEHGGLIKDIADHYDVSRQTIYNWLRDYDLRAEVPKARVELRAVAIDVVYQRLMDDENPDGAFDAAKLILLHLKDDGQLLLDPETLDLMRRLGLDMADVMSAFKDIIKQYAAQKAKK